MKRSGFKRCAIKPCVAKTSVKPRQKKCVICNELFYKRSMGHVACGIACALEVGRLKREKEERKKLKARKDALKTPSEYAADAQTEVNKYVKWRDWGKPCVSCGRPHKFDVARDASHLKSRGSNSALRFHLWNIHMSCVQCNMKKGGNIAEYYPRLIARIGQEKVDYLHNSPRSIEYSVEYLLRIKRIFAKKAKRLEKRMGMK